MKKETEKIIKPVMSRKSKFLTLSACSVVVAVCSSLGLYLYAESSKVLVSVPVVVSKEIKAGSKILAEDIGTINVHPSAITPNMVTSPESLIGTYSLKDISQNEYFYSNWISTDYYRRIADKAQYTAIPVPVTQFTSVNGEIKEDDFVMFSIIMGGEDGDYASDVTSNQLPEEKITILEPPQLSAVRVLGVIDSSGLSVSDLRDSMVQPNGKVDLESTLPQPTMLIVDVNDVQRTFLLQAMNAGKIQAVILPEAEQQIQREEFGLIQKDILEEENSDNTTPTNNSYNTDTTELENAVDEEFKAQIQSEADRLGITYEEALSRYNEQNQQGGN